MFATRLRPKITVNHRFEGVGDKIEIVFALPIAKIGKRVVFLDAACPHVRDADDDGLQTFGAQIRHRFIDLPFFPGEAGGAIK